MPRAPKKPKYQQPAQREGIDGAVSVNRPDDDSIRIQVTTNGVTESITMGGYNAWRIFGMLSVMLGLPLSKAIGESIQLKLEKLLVETPAKNFGEQIARHLYHQKLLEMQDKGLLPPGFSVIPRPKKDDNDL